MESESMNQQNSFVAIEYHLREVSGGTLETVWNRTRVVAGSVCSCIYRDCAVVRQIVDSKERIK